LRSASASIHCNFALLHSLKADVDVAPGEIDAAAALRFSGEVSS
jgi:hypothetical protein